MTRDDLIRILVDKHDDISYKVMCEAMKYLIDGMVHSLQDGVSIEIRGFGSFRLRYKPPRLARNPKTGVKLNKENKFAVHFKPGKELRERVNNAYKQVI